MIRFRDLIPVTDHLPTGPRNAITDVPGVRVGQVTHISGDGKLNPGMGPVRTGVTAIMPHPGNLFRDKTPAALYTINGYGKATGFEQIRELGTIESPICLTGTLSVGRVWDALVSYSIRENPDIAVTTSNISPVVGECNDNLLNDGQGRHITEADVLNAIDSAGDEQVEEGGVGAGTGTICYGFKGGIGTASRQAFAGAYTVGALIQTNFGIKRELLMLGAPIGRHFPDDVQMSPPGSVMIVIATDAPVNARQLERMAKRSAFGLGRTGAVGHSGSGDFAIAFSTANRRPHEKECVVDQAPFFDDEALFEGRAAIDQCFRAVVECVEESVYNSLIAAESTIGRDGNVIEALPHDRLQEIMRYYRRL